MFPPHILSALAESMLTAAWQGTVLVAVVALVSIPLKGMSATARFALWSAVCLLLLFLPFQHYATSGSTVIAASARPHITLPLSVAWTLIAAWALLSAYRLIQLLRAALHVRRVRREACPLTPAQRSAIALPAEIVDRVATSSLVDVPCVAGFTHPRVMLPAGLIEAMSSLELTQVVRHELQHIRRGDPWLNLLQKLLTALFPLNPGLWWAERRLCVERELACDDQVLRETEAPVAYALSLTNLAELSLVRHATGLMLGAWRKHSELSRRVHRILGSTPRWQTASTATCATLLFLLAGATAHQLGRLPSMVGFSTAESTPTKVQAAAITAPAAPSHTEQPSPAPAPVLQTKKARPIVVAKLERPHAPVAEPAPTLAEQLTGETESHLQQASYPKDMPAHVQPVLLEDGQRTYAAFHTADGWILIPL